MANVAVASQIERQTMNASRKTATNWLSAIGYRLILGVLVSVFALQAQSACTFFDGFIDNNNGTVTDPRNGVIWKRCPEGKEWNGVCSGKAVEVDWFEAMATANRSLFLDKTNWRIPTKSESMAVVQTSCKGSTNLLVSNKIAYSDDFWTSTTVASEPLRAWTVHFENGRIVESAKGGHAAIVARVRLVSGGLQKDIKEFTKEYSKITSKNENAQTEKQTNENQQRQARQMCEAQKQTCLASCGDRIGSFTSQGIASGEYARIGKCETSCRSIGCN